MPNLLLLRLSPVQAGLATRILALFIRSTVSLSTLHAHTSPLNDFGPILLRSRFHFTYVHTIRVRSFSFFRLRSLILDNLFLYSFLFPANLCHTVHDRSLVFSFPKLSRSTPNPRIDRYNSFIKLLFRTRYFHMAQHTRVFSYFVPRSYAAIPPSSPTIHSKYSNLSTQLINRFFSLTLWPLATHMYSRLLKPHRTHLGALSCRTRFESARLLPAKTNEHELDTPTSAFITTVKSSVCQHFLNSFSLRRTCRAILLG